MSSATKKPTAKPKAGKALARAPELKRAQRIVRDLDIAGPVVIKTPGQYIAVGQRLKAIKGAAKDIKAIRAQLLNPAEATVAAIKALFAGQLLQLTNAEASHKEEILRYEEEQRTLQLAEQRKVDERADKSRAKITAQIETVQITARNEAKQLRRDAAATAKDGDKLKAAALREQAKAIEAKAESKAEKLSDKVANVIAPIIQREAPKVAGISFRHGWTFEITDPSKVNKPFTAPDLEKIRAHVQALGPDAADAVGAGVRIFLDTNVASTSEAA